ncbi:hypothetical protein NA57DRAFT_60506 [Rhizodiscina lignyota]|uniref:Uncharacterized protein n=1 Tax=Rhizodiscina lignyota TaxID=1504668 RepID=A0A9P4M650_9PEZI|nr:hypothetical protein NA57DRAFT_60506 [Rhizodiscina lignyota]
MSALRAFARGAPRVSNTYAIPRLQTASFRTSAVRLAGKEDKLHHEGRAEEIEVHKQESLKKSKEGKGEWTEELGSSSESIIKAERGEMKTTAETIEKLQEETKKVKS